MELARKLTSIMIFAYSMDIYGIDLFAGAGGLSLGAKLAGLSVTHAIENNSAAAATYRLNHPQTNVVENDISRIEPPSKKRGSKLILFGGPPCQGFSTSNQKTRNLDNPQNWLFKEFFRFARTLNPDWIVLENVKGLRETAQGYFEQQIHNQFEQLDYAVELWALGAADFGVPQKRIRLFFIGCRHGIPPQRPNPLLAEPVTVKQAISDLPELSPGAKIDQLAYRSCKCSDYARSMRQRLQKCTGHLVTTNNKLVLRRYRHIPPGGNWCDIPPRLMSNYTNLTDDRSRHTGIYRRLVWDEPSVVISNFRKNMLVHPEQNRGLSVREAARLQSFPDHYRFSGSIGFQQQQVGNAVPPLLAKAVFSQIMAHS
jgi:DNA (cytosine-5)-methyltransferase 1